MNRQDELRAASGFLSYVLRHAPESIGVAMDPAGWVVVDRLIECSASSEVILDAELIGLVVESSDKQRFALSSDLLRIRANQGHSIDVDLGLLPTVPPRRLFHGTAARFLDSIMANGLRPGERNHVHLSSLRETAVAVGSRHGSPAVLIIESGTMHDEGLAFFLSENGVWLCGAVSPDRLVIDR